MTGDFNRDGKLDLAIVNQAIDGSDEVSILLGNGDGTFQTFVGYSVTEPFSVTSGDLNGDAKLDLVVSCGSALLIFLGNGDGTFQAPLTIGVSAIWATIGDFNGDGKLDLATVDEGSSAQILLGNGDGTFGAPLTFGTGSSPQTAIAGDFNRDGRLDLVTANFNDNTLSVLLQPPFTPIVTLSPPTVSFAAQLVGTASAAQTVTLSNTGAATLDITSIAASAHFLQANTCGSSVAVGASCKIRVVFRPSGILGTETGSVTITDNAPGSPQTVSLTGVGTAVSLSPTSLSFGNQAVGTTSSAQTVTLTNHAKGTLGIFQVRFTGADSKDFARTNTCGTTVPAGSSCTFSVTFTPGAKGTRTGTLNVGDDGGGSPQGVPLSGTGM